jgi:lipopolysaccharide/colanic/teichoic acid biosynthesis glycosyltransferase
MIPRSIVALFFVEVGLVAGSLTAAVWFNDDLDLELFLLYENGILRLGIVAAVFIAGLYFANMYANLRRLRPLRVAQGLSLVTGITFIAQSVISYLAGELAAPRTVLVTGAVMAAGSIFLTRLLFSAAVANAVGARRMLFLGSSSPAPELAGHLAAHPEFGLQPVGYVGGRAEAPQLSQLKRLGAVDLLPDIVDEYAPHGIVLNRGDAIPAPLAGELLALRFAGVDALDVAGLYETTLGRVWLPGVRPSDVAWSGHFPMRSGLTASLCRLQSLILAVFLLVLLLPLLVPVALLLRLSGPVFERRRCTGRLGRAFVQYRFCCTGAQGSPTAIGRMLERLELAGAPQLINVVLGHMSLVGPRPYRSEFAELLAVRLPLCRQRWTVPPGITGWAQIQDFPWPERGNLLSELEYDLYYAADRSPAFDAMVLLRETRRRTGERG